MSKNLRIKKKMVKELSDISFKGIEYVYSILDGGNTKVAHRRATIVSLLSAATNSGAPLVVVYRNGTVNFCVPFYPKGYEVINHNGEFWEIVYDHDGPWSYVYKVYPDGLLEGQWEHMGDAMVG